MTHEQFKEIKGEINELIDAAIKEGRYSDKQGYHEIQKVIRQKYHVSPKKLVPDTEVVELSGLVRAVGNRLPDCNGAVDTSLAVIKRVYKSVSQQ